MHANKINKTIPKPSTFIKQMNNLNKYKILDVRQT